MQLIYTTEVSLLLNTVTEHIDTFIPSWNEFKEFRRRTKEANICDHSRKAISTSSLLWNRRALKRCFRGPNKSKTNLLDSLGPSRWRQQCYVPLKGHEPWTIDTASHSTRPEPSEILYLFTSERVALLTRMSCEFASDVSAVSVCVTWVSFKGVDKQSPDRNVFGAFQKTWRHY